MRCKFKKAGATPTLCLGCFKRIAWEWFVWNHQDKMPWICCEMQDNQYFKQYMNRLQRRIRKAHKQHVPVG